MLANWILFKDERRKGKNIFKKIKKRNLPKVFDVSKLRSATPPEKFIKGLVFLIIFYFFLFTDRLGLTDFFEVEKKVDVSFRGLCETFLVDN